MREAPTAEDAGTEAIVDRTMDLLLDTDLPERHRERVREALRTLVDGDCAAALEALDEFESVCEPVSPTLQPHRERSAACHLRKQPSTVDAEIRNTGSVEFHRSE